MSSIIFTLTSCQVIFCSHGRDKTVIGSKLLLKTYDEGFFGGFLAGDEKALRQSLDRIPAAVEGLEDETERRA